MANCNGPCQPALTPDQIYTYLTQTTNPWLTKISDPVVNSPTVAGVDIGPVKGQGTGTDAQVTIRATPPPLRAAVPGQPATIDQAPELQRYKMGDETITATAFSQRVIRACAIIIAESGGVPNARNVNGASSSAPGSVDRGLCQFNDQAFSWLTDAQCYSVPDVLSAMFFVSKHFSDWGPWHGSAGLDNTSPAYKTAAAADLARTGIAVPADDPLTAAAVTTAQTVQNLAPGVLAVLGKVLALLTNGSFWQRVGIGALGLLFVVVAIVLFART